MVNPKKHSIFRSDGFPAETAKERWQILLGNKPGRVDWKRLLFGYLDWRDIVLFALIILMTVSYNIDTKRCRDIVSNPVESCRPVCVALEQRGVFDDLLFVEWAGMNITLNDTNKTSG